MTQVSYALRPVDSERTLMTFLESEKHKALAWLKSRNANRVQTPVRLVKVTTKVTEQEVSV